MGILAIHHPKRDAGMPINTSPNYCGLCWTPPGREHGLACPAVAHHDRPRFVRALIDALLPLALAADAILLALLIWSLT